jgi:putative resolvase
MSMEQLLTIKQVSEILGVSKETLRIWDRNGDLPSLKTTGGHRRWRKSDIDDYMGSREEEQVQVDEVCIYGRVSSHEQKQKGDLDRQCQRLSGYCAKKRYKVTNILKDVGSGLSDTRKSLLRLFDLVVERKISKVVIEHRDRLTRFQYSFFEFFFNSYGVQIEVVEKKDVGENEELVEDIMMLMASFSGKLYGRRSAKRRKNDDNRAPR